MPKVSPLGSAEMKAKAMAEKDVLSRKSLEDMIILEDLDRLKRRAGFKNNRLFAETLGFTDGRYRYMRSKPEAIRLKEIRIIQSFAKQYSMIVQFPIMSNERTNYG